MFPPLRAASSTMDHCELPSSAPCQVPEVVRSTGTNDQRGGWEKHVLVMSNWQSRLTKLQHSGILGSFFTSFHIFSHLFTSFHILKFAMPPIGKHKSRCKKFNSLRRDPLTIHINTFWYPHLLHSLGWLHHHQSEVACSATQLGYLTTRPSLHTLQ